MATITGKNSDKSISGTGTGLDKLTKVILDSDGLQMRVGFGQLTEDEIYTAAVAADKMNDIILEGINETGIANDGVLDKAEMRDLQGYIHGNYAAEWSQLYGNDTNGQSTSFHLMLGWGHDAELFGRQAICHVAKDVYQLGFDLNGYMLENEDGNQGQSINVVAGHLNKLLAGDLADGSLAGSSAVPPVQPVESTNTGLDTLVDIIRTSSSLQLRVEYGQLTQSDIKEAANAAAEMNEIIVEAINATGVAGDGHFSGNDVSSLQDYIHGNYADEWRDLHGNDTNGDLTGFHNARNWGQDEQLFGRQAICHIAEEVYQLGFEQNGRFLEDEDGNQGQSVNVVAGSLNNLLAEDLAENLFA